MKEGVVFLVVEEKETGGKKSKTESDKSERLFVKHLFKRYQERR